MMTGDWAMAHSRLSAPMNLGLLHPLEVVEAAIDAYRAGTAPLASVEGFVGQVIGWREYMWQMYSTWERTTATATISRRGARCRGGSRTWTQMRSGRRACPTYSPASGTEVGASHPAADGARQLGAAARVRPR